MTKIDSSSRSTRRSKGAFSKLIHTCATAVLGAIVLLGGAPVFAATDYLVGEGDVLEVSVYEHPDLTATVRVSGDGTVILPLVGQVRVAGSSVRGVEKTVEELLGDGYIVNPLVTVFIKEFRGRKVTILGEVHQSGLFELTGTATLLEIISKAGGLTVDAGDRAIIKRTTLTGETVDGHPTNTLTIDLKRLIREGDTSLNVLVNDGDSIYIPRAGHFFVTGEVTKPGSYKYQEGMNVVKAITMAGGFTEKAAKNRVRIIRREDGRDVERRVSMDEVVFPEDVLEIPESFF